MDTGHRDLYIQWCQSERVTLNTESRTYLVPEELLRRRSRRLRKILDEPIQRWNMRRHFIELPDTPSKTLDDFFIWTFSPQPQVDERAPFDQVVQLGVFGWRYEISALSNQVTDLIRSNLASGDWTLQASLVDDIYQAAPSGCPLREVIRAALGLLPKSSVEGEGPERQEWKDTFLKHAELGWDYISALNAEWSRKEYLSGVCRFHDHEGVSRPAGSLAPCDGCPYAQEDCYPTYEVEQVNGVFDEEPVPEEPPSVEAPQPEAEPKLEDQAEPEPEPLSEEWPQVAEVEPRDYTPTEEPAAIEGEHYFPSEEVTVEGPLPEELEELPPPAAEDVSYDATEPGTVYQIFETSVPEEPPAPEEEPAPEEPPVELYPEPALSEVNTVAPSESVPEESGAVVSDSAIEEVDIPIAIGNGGMVSSEKVAEPVIKQATVEVKSDKTEKKKKKKNKRNSVSQRN